VVLYFHSTFKRYMTEDYVQDPLTWTALTERPDETWEPVTADHLIQYISALLDSDPRLRKSKLARDGFEMGLKGEFPTVFDSSGMSSYFQSGWVLGSELREMIQWTHQVLADAVPNELEQESNALPPPET